MLSVSGGVIGDLSTDRDAARIAAVGVVTQINAVAATWTPDDSQVLPGSICGRSVIIENVGNLVCPAAFDLGEDLKAVVLSIAEGGTNR